jgi:hypothetical protein
MNGYLLSKACLSESVKLRNAGANPQVTDFRLKDSAVSAYHHNTAK